MATSSLGDANKQRWKPCFDYKVDYNDHFETPLVAYQDILPLLDGVQTPRKNHVLYDPYYCDGRTAILLRQLGFNNVVHAKRDFYKDIDNNKVPQYCTLITNPPYSDLHKEKCLEFCVRQLQQEQRPFFLLMPNYVAARNYYRRILGSSVDDVVYLIPSQRYEYDHPEGTGHEMSPFASLWFCGVGKEKIQQLKSNWNNHRASKSGKCPTFVTSIEELVRLGAVPTMKRPNPKQRKKRRANNEAHQSEKQPAPPEKNRDKGSKSKEISAFKTKKDSRYRDERGKRTKKRF